MIYFNSGMIQIPRHSSESADKLVLINELTDEVFEFEFTDMSSDSKYYLIDLAGSDSDFDLPVGTYRYQIGNEVGLWQVGDYVSTSPQYNDK